MLNQIVLVGRLVADLEVRKTESGKPVTNITLAIPRSFKNTTGEYETDFVPCVLWDKVAENTAQYCKKGDLVGVKGRVQSRKKTIGEIEITEIEVVAEKITFLSSKSKDE